MGSRVIVKGLAKPPLPGLRKLQGKSTYRIPPNVIRYVMGWPLEEKAESAPACPETPGELAPGETLAGQGPGLEKRETQAACPSMAHQTLGLTSLSSDHEVQDAPHLGPTAFLPGVMAIAPPQKKMQKIKKK